MPLLWLYYGEKRRFETVLVGLGWKNPQTNSQMRAQLEVAALFTALRVNSSNIVA